MNSYITGSTIKQLREAKGLTQAQLAEALQISDKTVSKWETGRGYPDITLIEPICTALGVSVLELLSGNTVTNQNRSFSMRRLCFYICPLCGNIIVATGSAVISCCGITLLCAEAEKADDMHLPSVEIVEDEYYVSLPHEMSKNHFISFFAAVSDNGVQIVKLYSEGNAEVRFPINRVRTLYWYCNRHGLFRMEIVPRKAK